MLILLFLFGCLSGCLPEPPQRRPGNRTEHHSSNDGFSEQSTQDQREAIHSIYEDHTTEGQRIVEVNIEYLKKLKKNNTQVLRERSEGAEINISEVQKKQLQEAAKERHFKNLETLLEL